MVETFDSDFRKQPTFTLRNSDGQLIGNFTQRNNGVLVPFDGSGDIPLKYWTSYPLHIDTFPLERVAYDKMNVEILDLERRLFPFPDSQILSSVKGIGSQVVDSLFFLRTNPLKILQKIINSFRSKKQLKDNMKYLDDNGITEITDKFRKMQKDLTHLNIKIIAPQRYIFELGGGEYEFILSPGGQIINMGQMEYSHLKSWDLSTYQMLDDYDEMVSDQQSLFANALQSEPNLLSLADKKTYRNACLRLKTLYTLHGLPYLEGQKFTGLITI